MVHLVIPVQNTVVSKGYDLGDFAGFVLTADLPYSVYETYGDGFGAELSQWAVKEVHRATVLVFVRDHDCLAEFLDLIMEVFVLVLVFVFVFRWKVFYQAAVRSLAWVFSRGHWTYSIDGM